MVGIRLMRDYIIKIRYSSPQPPVHAKQPRAFEPARTTVSIVTFGLPRRGFAMSGGAVFDKFSLLHINFASPRVVGKNSISVADFGQHDELKIVLTFLLVQ